MRRPALLVPVLASLLALGACGGGDDPKPAKAKADAEPAVAVPAGFVATTGKGWTFARPTALERIDAAAPKGKELQVYQLGTDAEGLPSQVAVGAGTDFQGSLRDAVTAAKATAKAKYGGYEITDERPVQVAGGEGYRIDATYDSFAAEPETVRSVNLYVRSKGGLQLNLSVRGPDKDFERLGLDQIVPSLRLR